MPSSWLTPQTALLVGQITWAVAVTFIRASVLALYVRIFRTKSFRVTCYVVHGINMLFGAATILGACLICDPISFQWHRSIPGGHCGDQKKLDTFIGVFNLLLDVTVVVLPMPVLWGLQMAAGKKFTLSGIFGLGIMYVQFSSTNRYPPSFLLTKIQHLYHYPDPHYCYRMESWYERSEGILPDRPLHLPRSPPRRHQRLPPRPEAHLQQAWRL